MSVKSRFTDLFEKVEKIKPMAEKDGQIYVNFDEAAAMNSYNMMEEANTGMQVRNRDGSIASTGKTVHAINPDNFFLNRYKKKNKTTLLVVSGHNPVGYRCIKEQETGKIHIKSIPVYVFVRADDGELKLDKMATVSDSEFISDFTNTLTHKSFAELLPMITSYGEELTADEMPI